MIIHCNLTRNMKKQLLIYILILTAMNAVGQQSNLYRFDKKLIADTTFQIDDFSYQNEIIVEKVLLPGLYNNIKYPEIARESFIEGIVIVQIIIDKKDFKYQIVKGDNNILCTPIKDYFNSLDKYWIEQIRPTNGILNMYIPIEFKIQRNKFVDNLKNHSLLRIETNDIAPQCGFIK